MAAWRILGLCAALWPLCPGCAPIPPEVSYQPRNPEGKALVARPADSVEIFASQTPPRPYREIGLIAVRPPQTRPNKAVMIRALRHKAGDVGCHAVILVGATAESVTSGTYIESVTESRPVYRGVCIAYRDRK